MSILLHFLTIFSLLCLASTAPSSVRERDIQHTTVTIINSCPKRITLGKVTNGQANEPHLFLETGQSKIYDFDGSWSGRFYGYDHCELDNCQMAGAASPASLAEFTFVSPDGGDYYDVSFVDGHNLPIKITPINFNIEQGMDNKYWCGVASCGSVPECPEELQVKNAENVKVGCQSACSKFGSPEYCCSGELNTLEKCPINSYAQAIKNSCPDVYTFAYDDQTSLFHCVARGYTVTFCP